MNSTIPLKALSVISGLVCIALTLVSTGKGIAQLPDYDLQLFDYSFGIRPGNIIGLTKDKQGFLWILYPRSVQRFEGRKTTSFAPKGSLDHIHCDQAGRIWVTSNRKVYLFDEGHQQFIDIPVIGEDTLQTLGQVFDSPIGKTGLLSSTSFFEFDEVEHRFERSLPDLPMKSPFHTRAFACYRNHFFIGHRGFLYRYNTLSGDLDSLPDMNMRRIFPVSDRQVLVTTWNMTSYWYDFDRGTQQKILLPSATAKDQAREMSVRSVVQAAPYKFIVAAREGLLEFDTRSQEFFSIRLFYNGSHISTQDLTNAMYYEDWFVWMATPVGVFRFSLLANAFGLLRMQQVSDDLPYGIDNIRSITEDPKGLLWLATGNGFVAWDRKNNTTRLYRAEEGSRTQLAYPSVRGIAFDGRHIILAPADLGVWIFDPERETYLRPKYIDEEVRKLSERDFFDAITPMRNGNFLLMGRDALYHLEGKSFRLSFVDVPGARENTNYAFQGHQGEIWLTTMKSLHLLDEHLGYISHIDIPAESHFVSAGLILQDNRFLFSTEDGVYIAAYDAGRITVEKYTDVFDGIFLSILFMDWTGILWAASENGIYRFDPALAQVNLYDYSDNLQGYGFNGIAMHLSRDSILFFGGSNGLNYFRPDQFRISAGSLNVSIASVTIGDDKPLYTIPSAQVELPYTHRSFEVSFVCPYFNNPEKLKYRYRLEGFDTDWKYIGNDNRLRITSLKPGAYKLLLEASINNVDWIPSKNVFSFRINPPFWLTWWFIAALVVGLISVLWAIIYNRNRRIREKEEELEAEQAINYFSTRIAENQTVEDLLWDVAKNCIGRLQFEDCVIYLMDEERNMLVQTAAYGPKSPARTVIVNPLHIQPGEGITGRVAQTGKAEMIEDTSLDPRYIVDDKRRYSELTVPIISGGTVLGVIDCEHSKKRFFTQRHLSILTTIASLCAAKIIKARAEAKKTETERILMETKQQMDDIEMQALRAQMNPHFIFNCLNSINRYIIKSDQATASLYLTRFAKLIRLILDNSNNKTVTLTNELEALRLYIEMESIRFEKQFTYAIEVDEEVHPDHVYVPPLIIQPYVENAIWHGLLHKDSAGHLKIEIMRRTSTLLECIIEDNGVGRQKAMEMKSKSVATTKSLGMKLTESRLALLNKHALWETTVEIMDMKDISGEPTGTRVTLKIPVDAYLTAEI